MNNRLKISLALAIISLALVSCATGESEAKDKQKSEDKSDAGKEAPTDASEDSGVEDDGGSEEEDAGTGGVGANFLDCSDLIMPLRDFIDATENGNLYSIAADFTLQTTDGEWNLKKEWSGCDIYLFIQEAPRQNQGFSTPLWSRDAPELLSRLPLNARLFFISHLTDAEARNKSLGDLRESFEEALAEMPQSSAKWLRKRIHYVVTPLNNIGGWLGETLSNPGWGIGIDRFQRIRYIGGYADPLRYEAARQWFAPNLAMAANEAIYYNFEAEREERLSSQNATVIELFNGEHISDPDWAGKRAYAEVNLPDSKTIASFDSMELDLYLGCVGDGEYGVCPPWDYLANLYLCEKDASENCALEIGRWVTTYHREGRWVHDISPLLPLFAEGGTRRFAFYTQQLYKVNLSIRLFNRGKEARPVTAIYLFSGGSFGAAYNEEKSPIEIQIPAATKKVALATVISGHGMAEPGNCAEFCNTTHYFKVNGKENNIDFPQAGALYDCMERVQLGVVPNQYGTWWYGRSGWCPGLEVPMTTIDITGQVKIGGINTFEYKGLFRGEPYPSEGANIALSSWLVLYE